MWNKGGIHDAPVNFLCLWKHFPFFPITVESRCEHRATFEQFVTQRGRGTGRGDHIHVSQNLVGREQVGDSSSLGFRWGPFSHNLEKYIQCVFE